jgi:hypothetical protein
MGNGDLIELVNSLTDGVFMDVIMSHAFGTERIGPKDCSLVVVENWSGLDRAQTKILQNVTQPLHTFRTFICCFDFRLTGAAAMATFLLALPNQGTTREEDQMASNRAGFI